jgi:hypothetical protein
LVEDGELLTKGRLDESLLPLATEARPKRVKQGEREREQDRSVFRALFAALPATLKGAHEELNS